jgi:hypothetical protein
MKPLAVRTSARAGLLSSVALGSALLLSVGCGSPDSVEPTTPAESEPADSNLQQAPVGQPIAAADAPKISHVAEVDIRDYFPNLDPSTQLVDKANPILCNVAFNTEISLLILPDQAWHTFVLSPFYI